ncbi:hypothetical protein TFLX_00410 [Thermoflexales bacterium]|nr:hypothetical protein TFLX_00410 [Thermoflexales bacterium]
MLLAGLALRGPVEQAYAAQVKVNNSASVIYVSWSATGLNNGASWANAFTSLETALDAAQPSDEIWVATGIYTPTERLVPSDPRSATFELRSGVALYGGFTGVETSLTERDWKTHPVILSGDISETNVITDNVYQVVYSSNVVSTTLLDGFTVTGGYADGTVESQRRGGGMRNVGGSPTIQHSVFSHNYAIYGGGMYNDNTSPVLQDVTIQHNTAQRSGGGVLNANGNVLLLNTVFLSNTTELVDGGALYNYYSNDVRIINSLFIDNVAHKDGGAMFNEITDPILINCTLSRNTSEMERTYLFNWGGSHITATNSILWGNSDGLGDNTIFGVATIDHSVVQGGWSGTGNLNSDPQFIDAATGDFRLKASSPAINAGDSTVPALPAIDLDGNPRIMGTAIDMGACEAVISLTGALNFSPDPVGAGQPITGSVHITNTGVLTLHVILTGTLSPHLVASAPLTWTAVITPSATWTQTITGTVEPGYHGPVTGTIEATTLEGPTGVFTATATALVPISGLTVTNSSPTHLGNSTTLTATVTAGDAVTYAWSLGDATSRSGSVITHTYPTPGVYTAVVTASNAVSVMTATTPVTITVQLYLPLLRQDFSPER